MDKGYFFWHASANKIKGGINLLNDYFSLYNKANKYSSTEYTFL